MFICEHKKSSCIIICRPVYDHIPPHMIIPYMMIFPYMMITYDHSCIWWSHMGRESDEMKNKRKRNRTHAPHNARMAQHNARRSQDGKHNQKWSITKPKTNARQTHLQPHTRTAQRTLGTVQCTQSTGWQTQARVSTQTQKTNARQAQTQPHTRTAQRTHTTKANKHLVSCLRAHARARVFVLMFFTRVPSELVYFDVLTVLWVHTNTQQNWSTTQTTQKHGCFKKNIFKTRNTQGGGVATLRWDQQSLSLINFLEFLSVHFEYEYLMWSRLLKSWEEFYCTLDTMNHMSLSK